MERFNIDANDWRELSQLLDAALDLPPSQRGPWIEALAPEFEPLKPRLRDLLSRAAQIETSDFLQALPKLEVGPEVLAVGAAPSGRAGDTIGPYRLIRELGSGGMGRVWLAERVDGLINRPVALKFPHGSWHRAGLAERMAREREILATLNHPNIARLYDAGLTADGQPYLALEYVEGRPIDEHCKEKQLDLRDRLRSFLQVANAVAYAHAKLIVHRDLKPSNILVSEDGQVRLLDFGVAKLLEQGQARETPLTELSGRALTPDYASPEHIAGEPITIGSDVYSLGVVLYELLTDSRPYRLKRDSRGALEDAILQTEPTRPSDVAAEIAFRKPLRGDIDTIVLKALKKNPDERYATVNAFADDIARYLQGRPVLAQPDSLAYRMRRFVGRNKLAVGAATSVLLAVMAGSGAAVWQARVAVAEQKRAEDVKEFVASIFREASPYSGAGTTTLSAVDLLKEAEQRLGRSIAAQPEVRIELSTLIGESLMALGDIDAAEPVLNRAAAEAQEALGEKHSETVRIALLLSQIDRLHGRGKAARAKLDRILPVLRSDPATEPIDLVTALGHRTLIAMEEGAYTDAEKFAVEGASLANAKLGDDNEQKLTSAILLALAYRYTKKFEQSRDAAQSAYRAAVARFGETSPHPRVAEAKTTYGRALADTGDLAAGTALIDAAVADLRTLTAPDSVQVGLTLQNLVAYQIDQGELALADSNSAAALTIITAQVQPESLAYAGTLSARAQARLARRDAAAALNEFNIAVPILERVIGAEHDATLLARTGRALALAYLGRFDDSQEEINAAANAVEGKGVIEHLGARVAQVRGTIARFRGDLAAALQWQQPVAELKDVGPKQQRERMRALAEIGLIRLDQGDAASATAILEQALKEFERLESRITPARADALVGLGRARLAQGRVADALPPLEKADRFWRDFDPENRWAGEAALWLGRVYLALGRSADAKPVLARAEKILSRSPLPGDRKLVQLARQG